MSAAFVAWICVMVIVAARMRACYADLAWYVPAGRQTGQRLQHLHDPQWSYLHGWGQLTKRWSIVRSNSQSHNVIKFQEGIWPEHHVLSSINLWQTAY